MRDHSISKWTIDKARQVIRQLPVRMEQRDVARIVGVPKACVHYYEVQAIAKIIQAFNQEIIDANR